MHYVYILQSKKDKSYYVGFTDDLKQRFRQHHSKFSRYSSSKSPFDLVWHAGFKEKHRALKFERYLKQGSGHAFARKRLA